MEPSLGSIPMAMRAIVSEDISRFHAAAAARKLAVMSAVLVPNPWPEPIGVAILNVPACGSPCWAKYSATAVRAFQQNAGSTVRLSSSSLLLMNSAHENKPMGDVIRKCRRSLVCPWMHSPSTRGQCPMPTVSTFSLLCSRSIAIMTCHHLGSEQQFLPQQLAIAVPQSAGSVAGALSVSQLNWFVAPER